MFSARSSWSVVAILAGCVWAATCGAATGIEPLKVKGEDFVDPAGNAVRFWGANLVACYPDHAAADGLAKDLAAHQINLARPHHNLRPSKDWNPQMVSGSLLTYANDSRHFDVDALDRFDYLNSALRNNGIYLALSINWTRRYLPGDVDVIQTDDADRQAWMAAMAELNGWHWKKGFDVYKMLPAVDERTAVLNEEFIKAFLGHVNPYTKQSYAVDPQVLTFEAMNEASTEYAIICGNRFPEYWERKLIAKWEAFAATAGIPAGDLYKPADNAARTVRARFLRGLDEAYFERIKAAVRQAGSSTPITFSNLWRGENALDMHAQHGDWIENHIYDNPVVTQGAGDFIGKLAKSALVGKPFIVGEINQSENAAAMKREAPFRSMLPLAAASYGSLHNWSGVVWFAWSHGGKMIGPDGKATAEGREPNIGQLISDGMYRDHLRTTGILFRQGLVSRSTQPITINVDEPITVGDYEGLMRGKYVPRDGWQNIHGMRKAFGATNANSPTGTEWMTRQPESPLVSDTGEIVKDVQRSQLTVATARTEAFSGTLDGQAPRGLRFLDLKGDGFATVVMVPDDGKELAQSGHLILSRTGIDSTGKEYMGPQVRVNGLMQSPQGQRWTMRVTRSRAADGMPKEPIKLETSLGQSAGVVVELPQGDWTECEIFVAP